MSTTLADGLPGNLPSIRKAQLPDSYVRAKDALATCQRIDECKDWGDKAAAMASYAKQAQDTTLEKMAVRIKARAIRRCGELLKQVEPKPGARTDRRPRRDTPTRSQVAHDAGLSPDQKVTALRVASIPGEDFEEAVESEAPPTVTELAERGRVRKLARESEAEGYAETTQFLGLLSMLAKFTDSNDPADIAGGLVSKARNRQARDHSVRVVAWLKTLERATGE